MSINKPLPFGVKWSPSKKSEKISLSSRSWWSCIYAIGVSVIFQFNFSGDLNLLVLNAHGVSFYWWRTKKNFFSTKITFILKIFISKCLLICLITNAILFQFPQFFENIVEIRTSDTKHTSNSYIAGNGSF